EFDKELNRCDCELLFAASRLKCFYNIFPNSLHKRNYDRVAELFVRLVVGNRDDELIRKTLYPGTFPWCQPTRISFALRNQNFRSILVVPGAERACYAVGLGKSKPKTVAFSFMLLRVLLQVCP